MSSLQVITDVQMRGLIIQCKWKSPRRLCDPCLAFPIRSRAYQIRVDEMDCASREGGNLPAPLCCVMQNVGPLKCAFLFLNQQM